MTDGRTIEALTNPCASLVETLATAFQDDPALSWLLPGAGNRRRMLPRFFAIMSEQSIRHGLVLSSRDKQSSALLYPAGRVDDARLRDALRLLTIFKTALPRGLKVAKAIHDHHPHPLPHLYLRYVGVAPSAQGQGRGGEMVREVIARGAALGQGVLLETATKSNVAIYARLGFEILSEWEVPGGGPKFWTMVHPAP